MQMADDGTITWMGLTVTIEKLAELRGQGLNPWLTLLSGQAVPAREKETDG